MEKIIKKIIDNLDAAKLKDGSIRKSIINQEDVMGVELKKEIPKWYKRIGEEYCGLILTDDMDSAYSCMLLQGLYSGTPLENAPIMNTGRIPVSGFYDFENLYINPILDKGRTRIFVDAEMTDEFCMANHSMALKNEDALNPNLAVFDKDNYTDKYAGSTFLMILSCYNICLDVLTEEEKMTILCLDSTYKGFYEQYFHETNKDWLMRLGYPELITLMETKRSANFEEIQKEKNLSTKIKASPSQDGQYYLNLEFGNKNGEKVTIPWNYEFNKEKEFTRTTWECDSPEKFEELEKQYQIVSAARTRANTYQVTYDKMCKKK